MNRLFSFQMRNRTSNRSRVSPTPTLPLRGYNSILAQYHPYTLLFSVLPLSTRDFTSLSIGKGFLLNLEESTMDFRAIAFSNYLYVVSSKETKLSGYNATCNFPPHVLKGVPVAYTTCLHFISLFSKNFLLRGVDSNHRPLG